MQLVLGTPTYSGLGTAGAPLPAPPERWRLGERARRILRRVVWALAFALLVALGALQGATVAIGEDGVSDLAAGGTREEPARAPSEMRERELRGGFWRPEGSNAERPPAKIGPRTWKPAR
jgi:hypothetical protein